MCVYASYEDYSFFAQNLEIEIPLHMMYHFIIFSFSLFPFAISFNILFLLSSSFSLCFLRHPLPSLIIRISIPSKTPPPFSFLPLFLPSLSFSSSLPSLLISPLFQNLLFPRLCLRLCIFPLFLYHVTSNSSLFALFFPFPFSFLRLLPLMGHSQKSKYGHPGAEKGNQIIQIFSINIYF